MADNAISDITPGESVTDPVPGLTGRIGVVGGIESLVLDGRRLWFGFDFTSDQVLSPLIDDAGAMARYAAQHMRQRTGAHDESYWAHLVQAAVENSDLVRYDEQRTFTTQSLEAGDTGPAHGHLLYLLDAAAEDPDDDFVHTGTGSQEPATQSGLRPDEVAPDDEDGALGTALARTTIGNWSLLFAPYARSAQTA
ncbi:hypothetical protein PUR34_18665 [Streptomyces sp. JV185]|uniref:hypothetical protein n=1 Tax=Streptomyces sp. JV185 TaxID=858638 RepID=UPI002E78A41E|nr:hypothetical protein [Streptomyces sp. JV185]MEE1770113.1 hypothetical protein [Streptomyces sp. JV185]